MIIHIFFTLKKIFSSMFEGRNILKNKEMESNHTQKKLIRNKWND